MVSLKYYGPVCTVRENSPWWMDFDTLNLQLSSIPGSASQEKVDKAKSAAKKSPKQPKKAQKAMPLTKEGFLQEVKDFEGVVPYMYRDTKDLVTVGIGFMIDNNGTISSDGLKMPFVKKGKTDKATEEEIKAEFDSVKKWSKRNDKAHATLELESSYIQKRFDELVKKFWEELKSEFGTDFETKYPLAVQYALLDMIFNLGRGKEWKDKNGTIKRNGLHQFQQLRKALDAGDWKKAGDASHRNGIGDRRNDRIKEWFYSVDPVPTSTPKPQPAPTPTPSSSIPLV